ncbi:hypothetical protein KMW40_24595 [Enterobacter cloacae]|uniref:hypothetical protein n=1 Tax=Enterobacter cloacae TaxID=550 RepID=UPI0034A2E064
MRELMTNEVEQVSGGYGNGFIADLEEAVKSSLGGLIGGGVAGAIIGGTKGGTGGGWGFGALGQLVGMIGGGLIGMAAGAIGGPLVGWNETWGFAKKAINAVLDGTWKL